MIQLVDFLIRSVAYLLNLYVYVVFAAVIFSWLIAFNVINPYNSFVRSLWQGLQAMTEPVMRPIRRMLPDLGGIDISPIIVLIALYFAQDFLLNVVHPNIIGALT